MKKQILVPVILAVMLSFGCNKQELEYVCNCEQKEKVQEFLMETIKHVQPMPDEKMEHVISRLHNIAVKTNCTQRWMWFTHNGDFIIDKNPLDSCETYMHWVY